MSPYTYLYCLSRIYLIGYNLTWVWDDTGCSVDKGMSAAASLIKIPTDAVIGPPCSMNAVGGVAQLFQQLRKPVIGYSTTSPLLSNKDVFPTFVRYAVYIVLICWR